MAKAVPLPSNAHYQSSKAVLSNMILISRRHVSECAPSPVNEVQWHPAITKCQGTKQNGSDSGVFVIANTPLERIIQPRYFVLTGSVTNKIFVIAV